MSISWLLRCALCLLFLSASAALTEDDFLRPIGKPPKAKPQMRQGGEALPPLPLPATPLRRSEKKRPPSPATLIGKVMWGGYKDFEWDNGQVTRVYDWNMVPADCQSLLHQTKKFMNLEYKAETVALDTFDATPAEVPVLYFSGGRSLNFTDAQREVLRKYMLAGGMVWFDSVVGSPFFYKSAASELQQILPELKLVRLPPDHPVFHMVDNTTRVNVKTRSEIPPVLDGVYIGSRLAAVVSPYGLGCGWDNANPELIEQANYYDRKSAMLLGMNLVAYSVGYFRVGQAQAKAEVYRSEDLVANADTVTFAQIRTNGVWNTEPGGAGNLLRFLNKNLNVKTNYRLKTVELGKDDLAGMPFLYLAGLSDFQFSEKEAAALRQYLLDGGYLLVDNSLGLSEFDKAARRELKKVLPASLSRIPHEHDIFLKGPFRLDRAQYTLAVQALRPDLKTPWLEGVHVEGDYRVIYSRYDLAAGWQGDDHPLAQGYQPGEALQLGANLVTYFLTH